MVHLAEPSLHPLSTSSCHPKRAGSARPKTRLGPSPTASPTNDFETRLSPRKPERTADGPCPPSKEADRSGECSPTHPSRPRRLRTTSQTDPAITPPTPQITTAPSRHRAWKPKAPRPRPPRTLPLQVQLASARIARLPHQPQPRPGMHIHASRSIRHHTADAISTAVRQRNLMRRGPRRCRSEKRRGSPRVGWRGPLRDRVNPSADAQSHVYSSVVTAQRPTSLPVASGWVRARPVLSDQAVRARCASPSSYAPRNPAGAVQRHLEDFLATAGNAEGRGLPLFVRREFVF
jgi:hypothetical protein